jgi:hypothetical protein
MADNGPLQFTAVYDRMPDGRISAYVAELDGVRVTARTLAAARARLAQKLRQSLHLRRSHAVRRASPGTRIEPIVIDATPPPGKGSGARARQGRTARRAERGETELLKAMLRQGLISEIPPREALDPNTFRPVPIQGKPISEEIIEDRR